MPWWCSGQGCGAQSPRSGNRFLGPQLISRSFRSTFFREVTFSNFDQSDSEKDDVTMVKIYQVCCLKDGTDGVVSTASTATSNPLPTLYCYDISGSNDRGG